MVKRGRQWKDLEAVGGEERTVRNGSESLGNVVDGRDVSGFTGSSRETLEDDGLC